eukprot:TRINITY_DN6806_c0_g3_i1.p1 TRINITY_DN6806_c0_g3~~TRINITY_DN6806_c0_g3_i1.p1  ORF type:complete len:132 (-),score=10.23 TRINITY_DN6806_c0_g3_i1:180-575(-)
MLRSLVGSEMCIRDRFYCYLDFRETAFERNNHHSNARTHKPLLHPTDGGFSSAMLALLLARQLTPVVHDWSDRGKVCARAVNWLTDQWSWLTDPQSWLMNQCARSRECGHGSVIMAVLSWQYDHGGVVMTV